MRDWLRSSVLKGAVFVLLLLGLFIFDDILVLLLFENLTGWMLSKVIVALVGSVIFLLNLGLALAVYRIMKKRPATGEAGMVGKEGVVLKRTGEGLRVRVQGEIWRATSEARLAVGTRVVVTGVDGLTLHVAPAAARGKGRMERKEGAT
ncbi:MAG: hypothetical protein D6743_08965 [Calditrichaeota bacterium]|nr:MAG: hypothetical protein D6743_08965 [Calditrichota bacterium]